VFDIDFFMKINDFKKQLYRGKITNKKQIIDLFESSRSKIPVLYNIETTNACNMRCKMCPRTTMMTRKIETLDYKVFMKIVEQIEPHSQIKWREWENFVAREYDIAINDMSENHFFLYIIPKVLQLHGYGDPLLDPNLAACVKALTAKKIPTYFSCNPANINIDKTIEMFESGLTYIKYSLESVDDVSHKQIRGFASNFTQSYEKINKLLSLKKEKGYKTTIIITMINLNRSNQKEEFALLRKAFEGKDVYIYLKSEDQQWYRKDFHGTDSVHWSEFCKHPWMSMSIKSNGEVAMCMEDFNNEIVLGDASKNTLYDIWNGEKYKKFREDHFNLTPGLKCTEKCDMDLIGSFYLPIKIEKTQKRAIRI
jgi:radical SAM protein with 4Fe4S-binding SPASM domain